MQRVCEHVFTVYSEDHGMGSYESYDDLREWKLTYEREQNKYVIFRLRVTD